MIARTDRLTDFRRQVDRFRADVERTTARRDALTAATAPFDRSNAETVRIKSADADLDWATAGCAARNRYCGPLKRTRRRVPLEEILRSHTPWKGRTRVSTAGLACTKRVQGNCAISPPGFGLSGRSAR